MIKTSEYRIEMTMEILMQLLADETFVIEEHHDFEPNTYGIYCDSATTCDKCKFIVKSCHKIRQEIDIPKVFPEITL